MSDNYIYARPYAEAAFKTALEDNNLKPWKETLGIISLVVADMKTKAILANPKISNDKRIAFLISFLPKKTDKKITLKEVESAIKQRNYTDVTRAFMPLRIPPGAVIVSTSSISKKEMFRRISKTVERKLLLKYGRNYKARSR